MDCGIVLEGGGARGAYHMGAVKAILEKGYNITGVTGTSIGSVNGAMIAQGDFNKAYDLWKDITYTTLFDIDENKLNLALKRNINLDVVKYMSRKIGQTIKQGGVDTHKMRAFLEQYVDEEKIRKSNVKYGLVTYSLTEKKPYELFVEDIPEGMLIDYIMASSRLPGFKQEPLGEKFFIDGGVYNNCPANMLAFNGFKQIFVIRTGSFFKIKDINKIRKMEDVTLNIIEPRRSLPNILSFESKTANRLLSLGYYDALKVLDNLDGFDYYFKPIKEETALKALAEYDSDELNKIYAMLKLKTRDSKKPLFETVIPVLFRKMGFKDVTSYKDVIYSLLEYIAMNEEIEQFKVYDIQEFLSLVKSKIRLKGKSKIDELIYRFVKNLEIK
jgi:NTE family protein